MVKVIEGRLIVKDKKFGIVVSRFNEFISKKLLEGAIDTLCRHGVKDDDITVAWVPGAFEIPSVARRMAGSEKYDGVVCLGAVIRGQTPHFDYVAGQVSRGVSHVAFKSNVPVIFGVVTTDTLEQAIERAGTKSGNKGADAALAAIEMVNLYEAI